MYMQKSDEYERIHNKYVQSEQVRYTALILSGNRICLSAILA